jgi:hypothetical protein
MTFVAIFYFGVALLPVCVGVAWCEWMERHERARKQRARERAHHQAADQRDEHTYRANILRHVNEPLGGDR